MDNIYLRNAKFDIKTSQENQNQRDDQDGCENQEDDRDHANRPTMSGKKSATRATEREQKYEDIRGHNTKIAWFGHQV